jgi:hypothetical protein
MRTNTTAKIITQAVKNVSKEKYEGNIILRHAPERVTKNVLRFTLKAIKADKPGALTNKLGTQLAKANWDVHQDVMNEIFKLDPRPSTFVDSTIYGRQYSPTPYEMETTKEPVEVEAGVSNESASPEQPQQRTKRKYTKRKHLNGHNKNENQVPQNVLDVITAIKYILNNPSILSA